MNILVTGANGFIGKNLIANIKNEHIIFSYDIDSTDDQLAVYTRLCDFVVHLAGVNRPKDENDYTKGNRDLTEKIISFLKTSNKKTPILLSSSIQATNDTPYGKSKKEAEEAVIGYARDTGSTVYIFRFPNVFGKWCRPNYNSAVATFCYNITHDLPISVHDESYLLQLIYIDDVINEIKNAMYGKVYGNNGGYCSLQNIYEIRMKDLVHLLYQFRAMRDSLLTPNLSNDLEKKLFSTFLSYYELDKFKYLLKTKVDYRGSFTEILKSHSFGQISVNICKPGTIKGNHWHNTKIEKFIVLSGDAVIRLRSIDNNSSIQFKVTGKILEVVDIPIGYTHNIENVGDTDLIILIWANEIFNSSIPDTHGEEV